jgi:hypothetical protein
MSLYGWPHAFLPYAICQFLSGVTNAGTRVTTAVPRERTYPLLVVQPAGLGTLGTDASIQADELRLQIDAWAERREEAMALASQVFLLLDARFAGALRDSVLTVEDQGNPGDFYECKIEVIRRSGGGDLWFDEMARVFRVTQYYNVKLNL